jgi:hypothetical protein
MYPTDSSFRQFTDEDLALASQDISWGDSAGAAFMRSGIAVGTYELVKDGMNRLDLEDDHEWDLSDHYDQDEDFRKRLDPWLADGITNRSLLNSIGKAGSLGEADYILSLAEQNEERRRIAEASGIGAELVGTAGAIGIDIAALIGIGVTTRGLGLGGVAEMIPILRSVQASRAVAAGRGAAFGAIEGFSEAGIQSLTDHTITPQDIALGTAMGLVFGGTIAAILPSGVGVDVRKAMNPEELDEITQAIRKTPPAAPGGGGSASAAATTDEALTGATQRSANVAPASAGSIIANRLLESTAVGRIMSKWALRSPKRRSVDKGVKGRREFQEKGLKGNLTFYDRIARLVRITTAHEDEIAGTAARGASAQDILDQFMLSANTLNRRVDRTYTQTLKAMFPEKGLAVLRQGNAARTTAGGSLARRFFHGIDTPTFDRMSDRLRKMQAMEQDAIEQGVTDGFQVDLRKAVGEEVWDQLNTSQRETLVKGLQQVADETEEFYSAMGRLEVELGVIEADELKRGYTPQVWNKEAIAANRSRFIAWLSRVWGEAPDDEWVEREFRELVDGETGEVTNHGLREGETVKQFRDRAPEEYRRIQEIWDEALADEQAALLRNQEDAVDNEVLKFEEKASGAIYERLEKAVENDTKLIRELEKRLETGKVKYKSKKDKLLWKSEKEDTVKRLAKVEKRLADKSRRLDELKRLEFGTDESRKWIRQRINKAVRKSQNELDKKLLKLTREQEKLGARKFANERIGEIADKIISQEAHFNLVPDAFKVSSARFKRRMINLGKHEFDPEADEFLFRDMARTRESFSRGVGAQLAVRRQFGLRGPVFDRAELKREFLKGYDEDAGRVTQGSKEHKEIMRDRKEANDIVDYMLADLLGDFTFQGNQWVGAALSATASMTLGKVLLSQLSDLAVQAFAGGKLETGFKSFFRRNAHIFKEMQAEGIDFDEMSMILEGMSTVNGRRFDNYADIERLDFDVPGGKMGTVRRLIDDAATVEGWANFMHVWNSHIRGGFGIDFANQIHKHITKTGWDNLSPSLRMYYSRLGLGKNEFEMMAGEFASKSKTFGKGRVTVPDVSKWDEKLLGYYQRAVKAAGDEAMLDPSIGDRPFLKSTPWGRIVIQFQSFVFTAADRFMAPLIQEARVHPREMRTYAAVLIGLGMAGINDAARAHMLGRGQEWRDRWDSPQGTYDNMTAMWLRGPFAVGGQSMAYEAVTNSPVGGGINETVENLTGWRPVRESTKFQQDQGIAGVLLGPAGGLLGSGMDAAGAAIEGDTEKVWQRIGNRLPVINTIGPQLLAAAAMEKLWE